MLASLLGAAMVVAAPFVTDTPMVHDPVMAFEDGTYYLYCTGRNISQMTSRDLKSWTVGRDGVLEGRIPQWTHDSVPGFRDYVWAPDVIRYNNRWFMAYSCSTFGKNTSAIGLLSNDSLAHTGGWRDEGCVIASREGRDDWNAIDPNFVIDDNGSPWLAYGSFWDGIQLIPLDSTMHVMPGAKPQTIARRGGERKAIEAPFIFRHDGYYYLFVSWDYCCRGKESTYRVVVGRSKNVQGPYVDDNGVPMLEGGGTLVIEGDKVHYEAAGHSAAYHFPVSGISSPSGDIFICHGYRLPHGESVLITKDIIWRDGWPSLCR